MPTCANRYIQTEREGEGGGSLREGGAPGEGRAGFAHVSDFVALAPLTPMTRHPGSHACLVFGLETTRKTREGGGSGGRHFSTFSVPLDFRPYLNLFEYNYYTPRSGHLWNPSFSCTCHAFQASGVRIPSVMQSRLCVFFTYVGYYGVKTGFHIIG